MIAVLAIGVPAVIVGSAARPPVAGPPLLAALPIVPQVEVPTVDPVKLAAIKPDDARAFNATIPFTSAPVPAAKPFRLTEPSLAAARAVDCLATAVLYEAGDDPTGQRAVAQVVINRVRHPAFPKTICGVVFQGSERRTGCQFTFACDGALLRHSWSDAAWMRARTIAREALGGAVYAKVGYATHYHTDWVVPYWSASLDKVSAVGTHLFFRWSGWWGTPAAFNRRVATDEPAIAQLASLSPAHGLGFDAAALRLGQLGELPAETNAAPAAAPGDPNVFLATIDRRANPDSFRRLAEASCGARPYCKYMAWTAWFRTPSTLPLEPFQIATMSFSYLRDRVHGFEKALWRCEQFPRADHLQCMKVQTFVPGPSITLAAAAAPKPKPEAMAAQLTPSAANPTVPTLPPAPAAKPVPTPPTP
ncbi:cell wall hydrolase [Sphingomonas sp. 28-63-12]|uniref:cell wall hydrolase n=1 Tax=Sphingomonas sp. 28-63-12 TaxID=1970434 RepID=UPI0035A8F9B1